MKQLTYLTAKLPYSANYTEEVVKRLNDRGLKPSRGETYTPAIVRNVVYGRSIDENVELEIIRLVAEYEEKADLVSTHLDAASAILNA